MTITKGITTIALTALFSGIVGAVIGYLIGTISPEYYRIVFRAGDAPQFDAPMLGLAVGLGQGVTTGVVVGLGIVLLVTWYEVRQIEREVKQP